MLEILRRFDKSDIVVVGVWILFIAALQFIVAPLTLTDLFMGAYRFMNGVRF